VLDAAMAVAFAAELFVGQQRGLGHATRVSRGRPGSAAQERALATRVRDAATAEYQAVVRDARAAVAGPPGQRKRTIARLRRELNRIRRRDYFQSDERAQAVAAVRDLVVSVERVAA
jgi:hypothetical protein